MNYNSTKGKILLKKFLLVIITVFLVGSLTAPIVTGDNLDNRIGIGLGNPYISIKYGLSSKFSIEGRGAFGSGIFVGGARLYYNFNPEYRAVIFVGGEGDYVSFNVDDMEGFGFVAYGFLGGEYFITKRLTFNLDIGQAYIFLKENESALDEEGLEWVFNLGINYYFK